MEIIMKQVDIWFVNLGIEITNHQKGITIGGFEIAFYGIMIGLAVLAGLAMACYVAKKSGQDPDMYTDLTIFAVIFGIIGARIYYVIFEWDSYKDNLLQIFNLRAGGLAIYGGIIASVITVYVYSKIKKVSFGTLVDTACCGLVLGQIIGRWGNFFNCEAFGGYCDNIFAMRLNVDLVQPYMISQELAEHMVEVNGINYIQVHPTFLYEGLWNLALLLFLLWFRKHAKWNGEVFCGYLIGYGCGRFWIESLRTDQLKFFGTDLAVSQLLSVLLVTVTLLFVIWKRTRLKKNSANISPEN
ncbi:MAG: prolipoprotein diacylglyceryl transferase [Clostridiales bacterium]|nr:prolipoprotein diacylglyceryl transferase [Clostridiales bacterium]